VKGVDLEARLSRLLALATYLSVASLSVGVAVAIATSGAVSGRPDVTPLLRAGIVLVILTPVARVIAGAIGFSLRGERELTAISVAVLLVLGLTVTVASVVG